MNKYTTSTFPKVGSYSNNYKLPPPPKPPAPITLPVVNNARKGTWSKQNRDLVQRYQIVPMPQQKVDENDSDYLKRCFWAGFLKGIIRNFIR